MTPDMPPAPPVAPPPMILTSGPKPPAAPGVAAIVNGHKIYRFQVANEAMKAIGPQLINQMILIELINQEAAKQHVVITNAQVNARLDDVRKQYAERVPGGLDALLAQRHQTLASYKDQMKTELKVEALVAKTLPAGEPTVRYHARHLLILTTSGGPQMTPGAKPPHTDDEAKALIAKAQDDLKAGKSFEEVANQYTEDPSNKDPNTGQGKGGDLGIIDAKTPFDPNFLKAALALKPGEVTPTPVKSIYGYHLIKLDSSSAAPLPTDKKMYDDAAATDRRQQVQQAIPGYVEKLRSGAKIVDYLSPPPTPGPMGMPGGGQPFPLRPRPSSQPMPAPQPMPTPAPAPPTPTTPTPSSRADALTHYSRPVEPVSAGRFWFKFLFTLTEKTHGSEDIERRHDRL